MSGIGEQVLEEAEKKDLWQLLHDERVNKINKAYAVYRLGPTEHTLNDLLQLVIEVAGKKLRPSAAEVGDVNMEDGDDFVQKAVVAIWKNLKAFDREPDMFYGWVMKTILYRRRHLYRALRRSVNLHVPLMLQDEEGNEYENPAVYTARAGDEFQVPDGLDEEEELICYMILDKKSHQDIAQFFDVHVNTIGNRVKEIKRRFSEAKRA